MVKRALSKNWIPLVIMLLVAALAAGCGSGAAETVEPTAAAATAEPAPTEPSATEAAPAEAESEEATLTVFAAASLTDAFTEIGQAFDAANPGVTTAFNFAGSNQLATQIGEGAPADVFASANAAQMDVAVESGRIDLDTGQIFVTNRLVVVYPADNPAGIATLQDLAAPDTLVVLAAEEVQGGRYTVEFHKLAAADPAFGASFKDDGLGNVVS